MPTSGSADSLLVDTSVAVALVVSDHQAHEPTFSALAGRRLGLAGHAAFETFSVLTRLPPPARRAPAAIGRLLADNFPETRFLGARDHARLLVELAQLGISGGSVYDAMVGAVAKASRLPLATRDRRALATYRALEVPVELL